MKAIILITVCLVSVQTFANTKGFDVKTEITVDRKLVSSPRIIVAPGVMASMSHKDETSKEMIVEMVASDYLSGKNSDGILTKFKVSSNKGGKRTVIATPQFISISGQEAEISVTQNKSETFRMKITATRIE